MSGKTIENLVHMLLTTRKGIVLKDIISIPGSGDGKGWNVIQNSGKVEKMWTNVGEHPNYNPGKGVGMVSGEM